MIGFSSIIPYCISFLALAFEGPEFFSYEYHEKVAKADSLFTENDFEGAVQAFLEVEQHPSFHPEAYYYLARGFWELDQVDSAFWALQKGLNLGMIIQDTSLIRQSPMFLSFIEKDESNHTLVVNQHTHYQRRKTNNEGRYPTIQEELIARLKLDRERVHNFIDSASVVKQQQIDEDNQQYLLRIIDSLGHWPGIDEVGVNGSNAAWYIAQHCIRDPQRQAIFLNALRTQVYKGNASPEHLKYLIDRFMLGEEGVQIFGTQYTKRLNEHGYMARYVFPQWKPWLLPYYIKYYDHEGPLQNQFATEYSEPTQEENESSSKNNKG